MRTRDFRGFRFGNIHTSDLNLEVVSTSNRYEVRTLPNAEDSTADIPGGDGKYYFGSTFKEREFNCSLAFDNVSEQIYRKIKQLFATDKLQDLVFDEDPYKTWKAKIKGKPEFKSICFIDKDTGKRVYKGDGKLSFVCYFPYAYGKDKYLVRAADYYITHSPECIIREKEDNPFLNEEPTFKPENSDVKYHYNAFPSDYEGGKPDKEKYRDILHRNGGSYNPNDSIIWKTGFPTTEQVQAGELFFDTDQGEKTIIDVRNYWDNVPLWQDTAKLLTTPTLDYSQELMYMPQYSKVDYVNMELGFINNRPMIGSRLLVYNPGDIPVDWELRFDENKRSFWSSRGGTKFRIRRFNVERLTIGDAVDWCGLTTYKAEDDEPYKYGNRYFKRRHLDKDTLIQRIQDADSEAINNKIYCSVEDGDKYNYYDKGEIVAKLKKGIIPADKYYDTRKYSYSSENIYPNCDAEIQEILDENSGTQAAFNLHLIDFWDDYLDVETLQDLKNFHPNHCYYVEPIPREKLGHYIKLFYWQTIQWRGDKLPNGQWVGTMRWLDMMPKDMFTLEQPNAQGNYDKIIVNEINNPLLDFLSMFLDFSFDTSNNRLTITGDKTQFREVYAQLDFEEGIEFANRYEELYNECIGEEEQYELYWVTLKRLLGKFAPILTTTDPLLEEDELVETFINSYINHPAEFIGTDFRDYNYEDEIFNGYRMPNWIASDYLEIDQSQLSGVAIIKEYCAAIGEDEDNVFVGKKVQYTKAERDKLIQKGSYSNLIKKLDSTIGINGYLNDLLDDYYYVNSDTHMLYTTANPYGAEFVYKPNKVVMNEAITKGKWFKIPPGWSLISIEPVVDESIWGGKRWEDARPFDWGYGGDLNSQPREVQQLFDYIYEKAKNEFFEVIPEEKVEVIIPVNHRSVNGNDELFKFNMWYAEELEYAMENHNYFGLSYYHKLRNDGEYEFLKIINGLWNMIAPYFKWTSQKGVWIDPDTEQSPTLDDYDVTGLPLRCINADISDWWWYACNYLWANFPPLYWAMADMLNRIQIKYTPLYY